MHNYIQNFNWHRKLKFKLHLFKEGIAKIQIALPALGTAQPQLVYDYYYLPT
jgi:hypothetical protein